MMVFLFFKIDQFLWEISPVFTVDLNIAKIVLGHSLVCSLVRLLYPVRFTCALHFNYSRAPFHSFARSLTHSPARCPKTTWFCPTVECPLMWVCGISMAARSLDPLDLLANDLINDNHLPSFATFVSQLQSTNQSISQSINHSFVQINQYLKTSFLERFWCRRDIVFILTSSTPFSRYSMTTEMASCHTGTVKPRFLHLLVTLFLGHPFSSSS